MVIYKITNIITNKIYVGKDEANSPSYMGSGKWLIHSINKYGIKNFTKEILEVCKNSTHLTNREKVWIKKLNANNPQIGYNLTDGGNGGNTYKYKTTEEMILIKKKISDAGIGKKPWNNGTKGLYSYEDMYGKEKADALKKHKSFTASNHSHTKESKEKMSLSRKGKRIGVRWINNGISTKQLLPGYDVPNGWELGRIKKIK